MAIVNIAKPPLGGMWKCRYRRFFNFLHHQVGQNWTDRGAHGTSKDLFVVVAIILEIVVVEDKLCKFHDVINGQVSERIGRVLKQQQVGVSYRPQLTINSLFPRPTGARWFWPSKFRHSVQNQLRAVQFCILWTNRETTQDSNCGAQKGSVKFWSQLESCRPCPSIKPQHGFWKR